MSVSVTFWGTRGSIPVAPSPRADRARLKLVLEAALRADIRNPSEIDGFLDHAIGAVAPRVYGGDTSCVEVTSDGATILLDLGTGARGYGAAAMKAHREGRPLRFDVLMSHLHWDHIMGFPFFFPAYVPGAEINIHGCHGELERAFRRQHASPSFPVDFDDLAARIRFFVHAPGEPFEVNGFTVRAALQPHSGDSYGWRLERDGKVVVYSTDAEHPTERIGPRYPFVEFFRDADLVVFDTMYSHADTVSVREDWGHSSNIVAVELCHLAGARQLALFHHEPMNDDATLERILGETRRFEEIDRGEAPPLEVVSAYDGRRIDL